MPAGFTLDFSYFREGAGGEMCRRLGFDIGDCHNWQEFREVARAFNSRDLKHGALCSAARAVDAAADGTERAFLHALLTAADFAWLADELAEGEAWQRTAPASGSMRRAMAACLAQLD